MRIFYLIFLESSEAYAKKCLAMISLRNHEIILSALNNKKLRRTNIAERRLSILLKYVSRRAAHACNTKILENTFLFEYGHMFKVLQVHMNHLKQMFTGLTIVYSL